MGRIWRNLHTGCQRVMAVQGSLGIAGVEQAEELDRQWEEYAEKKGKNGKRLAD